MTWHGNEWQKKRHVGYDVDMTLHTCMGNCNDAQRAMIWHFISWYGHIMSCHMSCHITSHVMSRHISCHIMLDGEGLEVTWHMMTLHIGSLSNDDGDGKEKDYFKMTSQSFQLLRDYSHSFYLSNVVELSRSWICKDGVTVQGEKRKFNVVCHVLHKTLNLVMSRCSYAQNDRDMYLKL